ncbi:hypothetical protein [Aneurinibacillus tyrosinisolvens]|nr:hypothetical protein [Aneurinibacillus tyrosinisolvens]
MKCPLCSTEKACLHQATGFDMDAVWEEIAEFGYPSFVAYRLDEKEARHR